MTTPEDRFVAFYSTRFSDLDLATSMQPSFSRPFAWALLKIRRQVRFKVPVRTRAPGVISQRRAPGVAYRNQKSAEAAGVAGGFQR